LFLGKRFTPKQLFKTIYPILVVDEQLTSMQPFINWMMVCGTPSGKNKNPLPAT
jgi:hypothetical protein